jgi:hypothetical protein
MHDFGEGIVIKKPGFSDPKPIQGEAFPAKNCRFYRKMSAGMLRPYIVPRALSPGQ